MPVQYTSAISYKKNFVRFKTLKEKAIQMIRESGEEGITNHEMASRLGIQTATMSGITRPLVIQGLVRKLKKRKCKITGNLAIAWTIKPPQIKTAEQRNREILQAALI